MNLFSTLTIALVSLAASSLSSDAASTNPISRIVNLLNGLKSKLEDDLKKESELYESYKCWYKTTTSDKAASNEAATSRVDSLKSYIKDIEAGKIEFTTEREDLEKQISGLTKDLEAAKTMRENEAKDFAAAKAEMEQAITALDSATKTIEDGTKGSLAQTRSYIGMLNTRHNIQKTLAFAGALMDSSDRKYLEQYLDQDPSNPDWKKLNRKATHKMKYTKSSGKILKVLAGLRKTFQTNLDDAIEQEKEAKAAYEKLSTSKKSMLDTANKALVSMAAENGARGVSKTEAQNEVDALEKQVEADKKFISEVKTAFETKEKEWEARKDLRSKEILAMSQAIAVLASDDAKDQFKSSFKSQGYLFLQEVAAQNDPRQRAKCAAKVVQSIASKSRDSQLALLAIQAGGNAEIEKVIKKVDEIIAIKDGEEKEDLDKKQKCETDLSDAASDARKAALAMDTATEDITRAESQIAELTSQLKEQEDKKKGLQGQIKEAETQRKDEKTVFEADKVADEKAVELVKSAIDLVKDWKNAKAALISQHKGVASAKVTLKVAPTAPSGILPAPAAPAKAGAATQAPHRLAAASIKVHTAQKSAAKQDPQFSVDAGTAPPPPPATWDAGATYEGSSEQGGIVGILELVMEDMKKDIKAAETDEAQAVKDFEKTKSDLEGEINACDSTIDAYTKDKADKEKTLAEKTGERSTKKTELEGHVTLYNGYKPGCDFLLVNFEVRTKARQIEVDGLKKAKAILKGAKFGQSLMQVMC